MDDKHLEDLADEEKLAEHNDLAIILYTYLGAKKVGLSSEFARYCQRFAEEGIKQIELHKNRENN